MRAIPFPAAMTASDGEPDALRADPVDQAPAGDLRREMCHEQRCRKQADRRERDAVRRVQRIGDRTDVRDVPRHVQAPSASPAEDVRWRRPPPPATQAIVFVGEPVERRTRARGARRFVSSSFVCERPRRLCTNSITVGTPARETSAASCSGPLGSLCERPGDLADGLVAEADQRLVEEDRLDRPDPLPARRRCSPPRRTARPPPGLPRAARASVAASRWRWSRSCSAVSTTEVTMPGLATTPPDVQTAPPPISRGDLADLQRELGRAGESVAPLVHRRRPRMGRLAAPGDALALDAEGAEHGAEREVQRLEHGALLDVQLEVRRGALELPPRVGARSRSTPFAPSASGSATPSRSVSCAQLVLVAPSSPAAADEPNSERPNRAPSSSAQSTSRTVTGGVPSLGDPAQHLGARDDVEAAVEPAAVRHRVDVAADQDGALGVAAERAPVVACLVALDARAAGPRAIWRARREPRPRCPSRRRAGRRSRRPSAPGARAAGRRRVQGRGPWRKRIAPSASYSGVTGPSRARRRMRLEKLK